MYLSTVLFLVISVVLIAVFKILYRNLILKINALKKENLKRLEVLKKIESQQEEEEGYLSNVLKHPRVCEEA